MSGRVTKFITPVAASVAAVLYPDLVPDEVRQSWALFGAYILSAALVTLGFIQACSYLLVVRHRGLVRALPTSSRDKSYEQVYTWARRDLLVWGVVMSKVSKEGDTFKEIARGGINVTFEMVDPEWLAKRHQVRNLLADFYAMPDILAQMRASLGRLVELAQAVNHSGEHSGNIRIVLVQGFDYSSGTIADPTTVSARGVVERHQYGVQTRFAMRHEARDYRSPRWIRRFSERTSYLRETLKARQRLVRTEVHVGTSDHRAA